MSLQRKKFNTVNKACLKDSRLNHAPPGTGYANNAIVQKMVERFNGLKANPNSDVTGIAMQKPMPDVLSDIKVARSIVGKSRKRSSVIRDNAILYQARNPVASGWLNMSSMRSVPFMSRSGRSKTYRVYSI